MMSIPSDPASSASLSSLRVKIAILCFLTLSFVTVVVVFPFQAASNTAHALKRARQRNNNNKRDNAVHNMELRRRAQHILRPTRPPPPPRREHFDDLLAAAFGIGNVSAEELASQCVLEIGANIGDVSNEPGWKLFKKYPEIKKVMVEPIPTLFKALQRNVAKAGIQNATLVNAALVPRQWIRDGKPEDGSATVGMYCWKLNEDGTRDEQIQHLPHWFTQVCSMDKKRLYANPYDTGKVNISQDIIDTFIVKHEIPALSVAGLMRKYNVVPRTVSYVQIDVEGFDSEVVLQLPLGDPCFRPRAILFEYVLLTQPQLDEVHNFLEKFYERVVFKDTFSIGHQNYLYILKVREEERFAQCQ